MELFNFSDIKMTYPIVYGIVDSRTNKIVYVGKTINQQAKTRIKDYLESNIKNQMGDHTIAFASYITESIG